MTSILLRAMVVLALLMFTAATASAVDRHCQDEVGEDEAATPDDAFELPRDGTVIHSRTGLQWAQCALGQSWSRDFCTGQATSMTWDQANAAIDALNRSGELAGYTDWRLPSRTELESIVETCREAPAINENIFPNTPWAGFWTRSLDTGDPATAWFVGFYGGLTFDYSRAAGYRVRPVRNR
jgi:hypothetical protein